MSYAFSFSDIELILAKTALARTGTRSAPVLSTTYGTNPEHREFRSLILNYLSGLLKFPEIDTGAKETEMRLRIALHLACPEAVNYDSKRSEPRWALVQSYLEENFLFSNDETEHIARLVSQVLDEWDIQRVRGLETRRPKLLERQKYRCACCHLDFSDRDRIFREEEESLLGISDPYKPYFDGTGVVAAMSPQVDHISVVSRDGTNFSDNLQVLCGMCNLGKGDGTGVRSSTELEYSHFQVKSIPRGHRIGLFYYRLKMDGFSCSSCGSINHELTIRMVRPKGLNVLTNLKSICYSCLTS